MSGRGQTLWRNRRRLLLLATVFIAPLALATVLHYSGWRPSPGRPHGELVTPAHPVADVALTRLDGSATSFGALRTRWALVYFGSSDCQAACERALYHMRQVIAAQGREAHRLQSVMIVTDAAALTRLREQLKDFPQTHALTGARTAIERLAQEFALPAGGALAGLHRIYVVDPLGNLMMSYTADVDPNGMRKDLARLLRYSQIG